MNAEQIKQAVKEAIEDCPVCPYALTSPEAYQKQLVDHDWVQSRRSLFKAVSRAVILVVVIGALTTAWTLAQETIKIKARQWITIPAK